MNAYIFINNNSVEIVKSLLNNISNGATHIEVSPPYVLAYMNEKNDWYWFEKSLGAWIYSFDKSIERVDIAELKKSIADFELIQEFGGLENSRKIAKEFDGFIPTTYKLCIMLTALDRIEEGLSV